MSRQKRRIRQLRMIYEGIMDDATEDNFDRGFMLDFSPSASV